LKDFRIEITAIGAAFEKLGFKTGFRRNILSAFEFLRCGIVVINGIPSSSAVRLTEKPMFREPAWDLFQMGAALDKFVQKECLFWDSSSRCVCHMCSAKDNCEVRCDKVRRIDICVTNYDLAGLKKSCDSGNDRRMSSGEEGDSLRV
jgi:hypothetical protein